MAQEMSRLANQDGTFFESGSCRCFRHPQTRSNPPSSSRGHEARDVGGIVLQVAVAR